MTQTPTTPSLRDRFADAHPKARFLDASDLDGITALLHRAACLPLSASVEAAAPPGAGNMNLTLRVRHPGGTLIVKQARPWVEKYPQIDAPDERVLVEAAFYGAAAAIPTVAALHPRVLAVLPAHRVLVMEDLGDARDLTDVYRGAELDDATLGDFAAYARTLHQAEAPSTPMLANRQMRALNHFHMYDLPFQSDNGMDLDGIVPGLAEAARDLLADGALGRAAAKLGQVYLADGPSLLHGDFYPGSWMRTAGGRRHVLDPEFAFCGRPEFDVAVAAAHLRMARPEGDWVARFLDAYGLGPQFDVALSRQMAGVEILRRLLGVAQLPLELDLAGRVGLLQHARDLVLRP
jgi:5-methylthioribose kinase